MQIRAEDIRTELSQQEKHTAFKVAFGTINRYIEEENYIGAYVLLFSVIEDRINALFAVRFFILQGQKPIQKKISRQNFGDKIKKLEKSGDLTPSLKESLKEAAEDRNAKLHAALWRHREFSIEDAGRLRKLARAVDRARREQKKKLGI